MGELWANYGKSKKTETLTEGVGTTNTLYKGGRRGGRK
jgi:hypothetical protein